MKSLIYFIKTKNYNFIERHLQIEKLVDDLYYNKINENETDFGEELDFCYSLMKTINNEYLSGNKRIILTKEDLKKWDFPLVFFEKIIFEINDETNDYILNYSKLNKNTNLFDQVYIQITTFGGKKLLKVLLHELCHAWDNYEAQINGSSLIELMVTNISSIDIYDDKIEKIYERIKYIFDEYESKAFLKQFSVIYAGKKELSFEQAKKLFIKDEYVNMFIHMISQWNQVISKNSKIKEELLKYVNKVENTNLSWNEYKKQIEEKIEKFSNKLRNKMMEAFNIWQEYDILKQIEENKKNNLYLTNNHCDPSVLFDNKIYKQGTLIIGEDIMEKEFNRIFNQ